MGYTLVYNILMRNLWNISANELTEKQNMFLTAFHNKQTEIEREKYINIIKAMTGDKG